MQTIIWDKNDKNSFEWYRSEICHLLKRLGDADFVSMVVEEQWIPTFWEWEWYAEAFYMLAIIDYLSDVNEVKRFSGYDEYRNYKLEKVLYPQSVLINMRLFPDKYNEESIVKKCKEDPCSKYFIKYNIVEGDIRNVA